jgi:glycosyltransferase 2 family protein
VKKQATKWVVGIGKYVIGFGLLAAVIYNYWEPHAERGSPGLRDLLRGPIAWEWLLACLLLLVVTFSLQTVRWYLLVRSLNIPFKLWHAFQLGLLGLFGNTFLPGSVGGDFFKAYFLAKNSPGRRTAAVSTVLMDRAFGLFGLILFAAVLGSIAWANGEASIRANANLQWMVKVTAAIAGGGILGFLLLGFLPQRRVDRVAEWLRLFPKVGVVFANLWYAISEFRKHMRVMGCAVLLTAVSQFAIVFTFYVAARVFPPVHPETDLATLPELIVIAPIGFIAQALPLAPGGVGVGEAAFAGLYGLAGRPESQGVIARLAMRIAELVLALVAWIVYFRMREEVRAAKEEAKGEGDGDPTPSTPPG